MNSKLERIQEAVEKLVPIYNNSKEELAYFAALCLDIVHEEDAELTRKLVEAEKCENCFGSGMTRATTDAPGMESPCDFCAPGARNN